MGRNGVSGVRPPTSPGVTMIRPGLALAFVLATLGSLSAASPDPKDLAIPPAELARARDLVHRLGSDDFRTREAAQAELAKMGRLALPALAEANTTDPSPEVRARAARLLPRAEADELKARVDTFLADADAKYEHDLPAWRAFRETVGTDKAARDLYVEILRAPADLDLFVSLDRGDTEAGRAIADRRMAIYFRLYPTAFGRVTPGVRVTSEPPTLADVAALMFAEVRTDTRYIPRAPFQIAPQVSTAAYLQQGMAAAAVNGSAGPLAEPFKRLFVRWLDSRTHPDDLSNYNITNLASNFRSVPETAALLRRVVTVEGVQGPMKVQGLMLLVQRYGAEEHEFLRSLVVADAERDAAGGPLPGAAAGGPGLAVGTAAIHRRHALVSGSGQQVWFGNNVGGPMRATCQLRDYALGLLVHQAGQNLRDYGFDFPPGNGVSANQIPYANFAFLDDDTRTADQKRDAAIAKWREYEADRAVEATVRPNPFRR